MGGGVAPECYTKGMPTKRARLTVTETPEIADRLDFAATRFPDLAGRRRELLVRLTELGEAALLGDAGENTREAAKRRVLARTRAITPEEADWMTRNREDQWSREIEG